MSSTDSVFKKEVWQWEVAAALHHSTNLLNIGTSHWYECVHQEITFPTLLILEIKLSFLLILATILSHSLAEIRVILYVGLLQDCSGLISVTMVRRIHNMRWDLRSLCQTWCSRVNKNFTTCWRWSSNKILVINIPTRTKPKTPNQQAVIVQQLLQLDDNQMVFYDPIDYDTFSTINHYFLWHECSI